MYSSYLTVNELTSAMLLLLIRKLMRKIYTVYDTAYIDWQKPMLVYTLLDDRIWYYTSYYDDN